MSLSILHEQVEDNSGGPLFELAWVPLGLEAPAPTKWP
ncbi:hypothetical protein SCATT_17960 [Streptantibioticus cattleyicolor NRRL 8057 = DSM 46488]|uniref:Uncharacterized protein n=1 Tax=Streptantibioticus cattleyicolor (strain ATCC 35852 / DSM 46488 / JCM 4925 / NBRC 14057 / NRRL 8057) TaxID=1003195 RepID=G8WQA7_STREN|nr:hypothetical protein SCATT_17960 [Streptantibioticus cattleyicolor NRRL 8057 = DSM 46488]